MTTEKKRSPRIIFMIVLTAFIASGLVFVQGGYAGDAGMVKTAKKAGLAAFLVDGNGMTLYYFKNDPIGKSACVDKCIERWPLFFAEKITVSGGLNARDFGTIKRDDGKKQTTYKGQPLYYFAKDQKPGDTFGNGIRGSWYVVPVQ